MKITKSQLEQLIREELENTLVEVQDPGAPPFNYAAELRKVGGDKKKLDRGKLKQYRDWYKQKQAFKKAGGTAKPAAGKPAQQKAGGAQKGDPAYKGSAVEMMSTAFETKAIGNWKQKSLQTAEGWLTMLRYKGKLLVVRLDDEGRWTGAGSTALLPGGDPVLALWNHILKITEGRL